MGKSQTQALLSGQLLSGGSEQIPEFNDALESNENLDINHQQELMFRPH